MISGLFFRYESFFNFTPVILTLCFFQPRSPLTPKEVTLVRQKATLSSQVTRLKTQCRDLDSENNSLAKLGVRSLA